jgi:SpoVK/Ycf46/Vps4 family AAA+-type ATPase
VKNQPSIIFIDEIDSLLSSRNDGEQEGSRRIKTEFLVQMDGAGTNPDDRILLIGATNRPQELDEAMRRRLAKRMFIPLPNADGRKAILKNLLKDVPNVIGDQELEEIVRRSKGYSGSDMKNLCTEASMVPLRDIGDISNLVIDEIPPVGLKHFIAALDGIRSSVSQADIQQLLLWNKDFGSFQFDYSALDT